MRTINAKSVVVLAALAGASASGWAQMPVQQESRTGARLAPVQTHGERLVAATNQVSGGQSVALYSTPAPRAQQPPDRQAVAAAPTWEPASGQENANMGMMILVGLGMVGTLMVKGRPT